MKRILCTGVVIAVVVMLFSGCAKMPDEKLLVKGKQMESEQKFTEAIASYDKLIGKFPTSPLVPEAIYQKALVHANALQEYDIAVSGLMSVLEKYPENRVASRSQFMIGFIYANSVGDTAKAGEAYRTFLKKYPNDELKPSVEWELKYLGKDIDDIPELTTLGDASEAEAQK
ncbi:tetratricopeptide repeat protein [bacterium]|nr:tetratricopeptide repeat protein [bacterium]